MIFVNDGSTDQSLEVLRGLAEKDKHVRVIVFRRNFGQTAAISAGATCFAAEVSARTNDVALPAGINPGKSCGPASASAR